ncbi:MAG: NADH-quinone oxidoreductase subunit B family protein, partial [Thermoanaerobaculia bacterium]
MRLNHGQWAASNHSVEKWLVHKRRLCMRRPGSWFEMELEQRGISRREFVEFCGVMATALALPKVFGSRIAEAVLKAEKPVIVWLEFQDCAGNTESFLRATKPTVADVVLDVLSVDYHETIMAAAGHQAEDVLAKTVKEKKGAYLAVVEGSIPTGANGAYC